jgi:hypothetical protein
VQPLPAEAGVPVHGRNARKEFSGKSHFDMERGCAESHPQKANHIQEKGPRNAITSACCGWSSTQPRSEINIAG